MTFGQLLNLLFHIISRQKKIAYSGCYISGSNNLHDLFSSDLTNAMILKAGFTNPYGPDAAGTNLAFDSNMTNDMCMNFCLSNGFFYSGTMQK